MKTKKDQHPQIHQQSQKSWFPLMRGFILILIFIIIGYYLFTEHREHVAGFLAAFPWWVLLFLLCPLMHLFHGGHGHHEGHHHPKDNNTESQEKDK